VVLGAQLGGRVIDAFGHAHLGEVAALVVGLSMLVAWRLMPNRQDRLTPA